MKTHIDNTIEEILSKCYEFGYDEKITSGIGEDGMVRYTCVFNQTRAKELIKRYADERVREILADIKGYLYGLESVPWEEDVDERMEKWEKQFLNQNTDCEHKLISMKNEVIEDGYYCSICGKLFTDKEAGKYLNQNTESEGEVIE